jgi:tetraacyldisaccharide-1-P 4'-kinase
LARPQATALQDFPGKALWDFSFLKGKRFSAFCGLARPWSFQKTLASLSLTPVAFRAFPDHEPYGPLGRKLLEELYKFSNVEYLLTTEKDAVKLRNLKIPLLVLESALFPEEPELLVDSILELVNRA